jgi:endoglucanase
MTPRTILCILVTATTAAAAGERPNVAHVGLVAPDIIGITIHAGHAEYGRQIPYKPHPNDRVDRKTHQRWVRRGGEFLGSLVGKDEKLLYTPDRRVGPTLDTAWADRPDSYRISSPDDPAFHEPTRPTAVHRKSKPTDFARVDAWRMEAPMEHVLYLRLPKPLTVGKRYAITFSGQRLAEQSFQLDPATLRSEAVHVSHLGFRPDDPVKVAFLSCWLGSGGPLDYREGLPFRVVDSGGKAVFQGTTRLAKSATEPEDAYKRNHNGTDVYLLDFSSVTRPGTYRVTVEGIGCSDPFPIADDVWRRAFVVSARGVYHQRSGIELGPPFTAFKRPRCFHPDDGPRVFHSTCPLMNSGNGLNRDDSNFGNLNKGRTDRTVPNAWGGTMDAGDWDRRIQHLDASRLLLELAELFPSYFADLPLNIPESDDALPDIVNEALWNLDCYRRMQTPAGGIRGGIESAEHPRHGEASWQESLTVMAYAPGIWSSHVYAGVAARAAYVLRDRAPKLAAAYKKSALRAMNWAEQELDANPPKDPPHQVNDARNLAAAELYRLTGNDQWHDLFLATTVFHDPKTDLYKWKHHEQADAAFVYARTKNHATDDKVRRNALAAIRRQADARIAQGKNTGFRWTKNPWRPLGWGIPASPDAVSLCRAHALTDQAAYLRAAVLACQFGGGANPSNLCYTTGLGHRSPEHPLHLDSRITHQAPPPGLTIFGPADVQRNKGQWGQKLVKKFAYPDVETWPSLEAFFDVFWYPPMCEFTIHQPMATNAYVWGYLAARDARQ